MTGVKWQYTVCHTGLHHLLSHCPEDSPDGRERVCDCGITSEQRRLTHTHGSKFDLSDIVCVALLALLALITSFDLVLSSSWTTANFSYSLLQNYFKKDESLKCMIFHPLSRLC